MISKRAFLWLLCVQLVFAAISLPAKAQLSQQIGSIIENSRASNAYWSIQVRDSTGKLLENRNGEKLIRPASNLKLISTGAFLDRLGPDYRFETTLYGKGHLDEGIWHGDLIVKGSGDPSISGSFYESDALFLFEKWYRLLRSMGVNKINGNLIGYDGLFDDVPYPKGWEWDDLSYYYAPEISALSFNSNVVELEVVADGRIGSTPEIQWYPFNTPYVDFVNEQLITPPGTRFNESYRRELGTNTIILRSTLPRGHYETEPLTITNPTLYFIDTFSRYLQMGGIELTGFLHIDSDFYGWSNRGFEKLDSHISEPLHKMVTFINRESDNFFAEMLLKKMAAEEFGVQGTTDLGLQIMKEFMHEMEFDTVDVNLRDASGMAPSNLVKASDLNRYLLGIQNKPYFDRFFESLSVGGLNGTLGHRFRNSSAREKFYGKSGFISGVRALSGYLDTQSGNRLSITIATNNYTVRTSHVDYLHERIIEFLHSEY